MSGNARKSFASWRTLICASTRCRPKQALAAIARTLECLRAGSAGAREYWACYHRPPLGRICAATIILPRAKEVRNDGRRERRPVASALATAPASPVRDL
jgi:hypothetical protein